MFGGRDLLGGRDRHRNFVFIRDARPRPPHKVLGVLGGQDVDRGPPREGIDKGVHRDVLFDEGVDRVHRKAVIFQKLFDFLLPKHDAVPLWIRQNPRCAVAFVAGYIDAEGSFHISYMLRRLMLTLLSCAPLNPAIYKSPP